MKYRQALFIFAVISLPCSGQVQREPHKIDRHVVVTYDISKSITDYYLGAQGANPTSFEATLRNVVSQVLTTNEPPEFPSEISGYRLQEYTDLSVFRPFPLALSGNDRNTVLSLAWFADKADPAQWNASWIRAERDAFDPDRLQSLLPVEFTGNNTNLDGVRRLVCERFFDPTQEAFAYWVYISDGQHDPSLSGRFSSSSGVDETCRIELVYRLDLLGDAERVAYWRSAYDDAGHPMHKRAINAFGPEGPPREARIMIFEVSSRKTPGPPVQLDLDVIQTDESTCTYTVGFAPSEVERPAFAGVPAGQPLAVELASRYVVETSIDGENWRPIEGGIIAAEKKRKYTSQPLKDRIAEGSYFIRVVAESAQGMRSRGSTAIHTAFPDARWDDANQRITVIRPRSPSIVVKLAASEGGLAQPLESISTVESVAAGEQLSFETAKYRIERGSWAWLEFAAADGALPLNYVSDTTVRVPFKDEPRIPKIPENAVGTATNVDANLQTIRLTWEKPDDSFHQIIVETPQPDGTWRREDPVHNAQSRSWDGLQIVADVAAIRVRGYLPNFPYEGFSDSVDVPLVVGEFLPSPLLAVSRAKALRNPKTGITRITWRQPNQDGLQIVIQRRNPDPLGAAEWIDLDIPIDEKIDAGTGKYETSLLHSAEIIQLASKDSENNRSEFIQIPVENSGSGVGGVAGILILGLLVGGTIVAFKRRRERRSAFTIVLSPPQPTRYQSQSKTIDLAPGSVFLFEKRNGTDEAWDEIHAPNDYLECRKKGSVFHVRVAKNPDTGKTDFDLDKLLKSGDAFEVLNKQNERVRMEFNTGSANGAYVNPFTPDVAESDRNPLEFTYDSESTDDSEENEEQENRQNREDSPW